MKTCCFFKFAWVGFIASSACSTGLRYVWVDELQSEAMLPMPYRIFSGDELHVLVWNNESMSAQVRVRPDGRITLPLLGDVSVGGLTSEGAATQIARRLDGLVVQPKVTVNLTATRDPTFSVLGEVNSAGVFPLRTGDGVLHAIAAAGGLSEFASEDSIYVLRKSPDLMRIRFAYQSLLKADGMGVLFHLHDGDIVVVE